MNKLGITENLLRPSRTTFHGIVPRVSCTPMGSVRVDVIFGTKENCRVENIEFEVVDLTSPYHMLLGRPAIHKFMASVYISYLKLKMPGPNGVITINGNYKRSLECSSAGSNLAQSLAIAEEKEDKRGGSSSAGRSSRSAGPQPDTRKCLVQADQGHKGDPAR